MTTVGKRVLARATVPTVRAASEKKVFKLKFGKNLAFTFLQKKSGNPLGIQPSVGVLVLIVSPVSSLVTMRSSLICVWSRKT